LFRTVGVNIFTDAYVHSKEGRNMFLAFIAISGISI
jgi:hypothetical protein